MALRFMDIHEKWVQEIKTAFLRKQVQVGFNQLESGEGSEIESKEALNSLFSKLYLQVKSWSNIAISSSRRYIHIY